MLRDPGVDLVAVTQDSQAGLGKEQASFYTTQARSVTAVYAETTKPVILFSNVSGGFHPAMEKIYKAGNVPALQGTRESLKAIRHLIDHSLPSPTADGRPEGSPPPADRPDVDGLLVSGSLSEYDSKRLLAAYGIPITRQELVDSAEAAVGAAARIGGRVVLKIDSPDVQHKSDVGGVRLGLAGERAVRQAYHDIMTAVRQAHPEARLNGILVQEMLPTNDSIEIIVGMTRDPQCGPAVMFGLGGIYVEVLEDVALRVAPLKEEDAWGMMDEIRGAALLDGARGRPPVDKSAIAHVLLQLSTLAMQLGDRISAIDINPLVVFPAGQGATAADALVVVD
jgi:acetyltransferase